MTMGIWDNNMWEICTREKSSWIEKKRQNSTFMIESEAHLD